MSETAGRTIRRSRVAGIACGAGAGALWGLVFLAPELVSGISPVQLTIGRYLAYGLLSLALILPVWRKLRHRVDKRDWINLALLAFFGNIFYYILLSAAVQTGGIALTSLVIGFMPVAVTIIGSRDHNAVPLGKLWLSLVFCVTAAVCIGWEGVVKPDAVEAGRKALALCFAVGALVSWTGFAVGNSRCLGRLEAISAHQWSLLTGLMTGMQALVLVPVSLVLDNWGLSVGQWGAYVGVSVAVALLASIVGNALWNQMSRHLPLTLIGQMILFETLFALIYGFMWEQRWPSFAEALAFGCVVVSVTLCLKAHRAAKD